MKKTVLITGATSGIGEACAHKFAEGGYDLILTARRADKLAEIKAEMESKGARVKTLVFDVRDVEAAKAAVESLEGDWQTIDVLINNAGLALGLDKEYEGDIDEWATMKQAGEPLNAGKIAELSGLDRKEVDKAMKELKAEGAIVSPVRCKWAPAE